MTSATRGAEGLSREEFLDKLDRLTVRTVSPDRSVRATLTMSGTSIEFSARGSEGHTETSLALQITAALDASQQGYQRAIAVLLGQAIPDAPTTRRRPSPQKQRYLAAVDAIDITCVSPREYVKVRRTGASGIEVRIRPNSLGQFGFDDAQLLVELNAAIQAAEEEHTRRFEDVRKHSAERSA